MQAETILIESNRKIATSEFAEPSSQTNTVVEDKRSRANWTTTIGSPGIELNIGDKLSLQSAAVNLLGTSNEMLTFTGAKQTPNDNNVFETDNQTRIKIGYYVSGNETFNFPLPSADTKVDRSFNTSVYGKISLDGQYIGDGLHKSTDNTAQGWCAGFEAYTGTVPYRALPAVMYDNISSSGTISIPSIIDSPKLWQSSSVGLYEEKTPLYKGSNDNTNPNNLRFYVPDRKNMNSPIWDPAVGGAQAPISNQWEFHKTTIDFEIEEGLSPPERVGQILTQQLKSRVGDASEWIDEDLTAGTFSLYPPVTSSDDTTPRQLVFNPYKNISGNTYINWPSSTGALLFAKLNNEWSAELDNESRAGGNRKACRWYKSK